MDIGINFLNTSLKFLGGLVEVNFDRLKGTKISGKICNLSVSFVLMLSLLAGRRYDVIAKVRPC